MPLVNAFLKKADIPLEQKYELTVAFCQNCYLVQLNKTVSPEKLFTKYLFPFEVTSIILLAAIVGAVVLAKRRFE